MPITKNEFLNECRGAVLAYCKENEKELPNNMRRKLDCDNILAIIREDKPCLAIKTELASYLSTEIVTGFNIHIIPKVWKKHIETGSSSLRDKIFTVLNDPKFSDDALNGIDKQEAEKEKQASANPPASSAAAAGPGRRRRK